MDPSTTDYPPLHGTRAYARLPLTLFGIVVVVSVATLVAPPAGRQSWLLEMAPAIIGYVALGATYGRFPMSTMVYWFVFVHTFILMYGGIYTYAETPLGNWAQEAFDLGRNHYDRVGHFAMGFFPAIVVREVLLRNTPLRRGGWFFFIICSVVLAIAAFWELVEWWTTLVVASDVGAAFLGSQGDIWDAQWDMFLALVGALVSLPLFSARHDRSLARTYAQLGGER